MMICGTNSDILSVFAAAKVYKKKELIQIFTRLLQNNKCHLVFI